MLRVAAGPNSGIVREAFRWQPPRPQPACCPGPVRALRTTRSRLDHGRWPRSNQSRARTGGRRRGLPSDSSRCQWLAAGSVAPMFGGSSDTISSDAPAAQHVAPQWSLCARTRPPPCPFTGQLGKHRRILLPSVSILRVGALPTELAHVLDRLCSQKKGAVPAAQSSLTSVRPKRVRRNSRRRVGSPTRVVAWENLPGIGVSANASVVPEVEVGEI